MRVREMIKFLVENKGWYLVRVCGCHRQFKLRSKKSRLTINSRMDMELAEGALYHSINQCFDAKEIISKDQYEVTIEESSNCYSAYSSDLPGCVVVGDTVEETKELMIGAVKLHLEGLKQEGLLVPDPRNAATYFELKQAS
jgi:predicted RNase H-like HicB family nuclease/predicted RNA binding protein YcfA (HicA-like mRNA interferase family)